jgi:hypothetical protein
MGRFEPSTSFLYVSEKNVANCAESLLDRLMIELTETTPDAGAAMEELRAIFLQCAPEGFEAVVEAEATPSSLLRALYGADAQETNRDLTPTVH